MGYLTVISETGFFHSAVMLQRDNSTEQKWFGFKPTKSKMPIWSGHVDISDRTDFVNHYVRFQVADSDLDDVETMIDQKYAGTSYVVGVRDCVSLSADAAWECHLKVTIANMTPFGLVVWLARNNGYSDYDTRPLPWI